MASVVGGLCFTLVMGIRLYSLPKRTFKLHYTYQCLPLFRIRLQGISPLYLHPCGHVFFCIAPVNPLGVWFGTHAFHLMHFHLIFRLFIFFLAVLVASLWDVI